MDRRTIWAILLMMVIAIAPAIFMKKAPAAGQRGQRGSGADTSATSSGPVLDSGARRTARDSVAAPGHRQPLRPAEPRADSTTAPLAPRPRRPASDDTVRVTLTALYLRHQHAGRPAGRGDVPRYRSMAPTDHGQPAADPPARQSTAGPDPDTGTGHHPAGRLALHGLGREPRRSRARLSST